MKLHQKVGQSTPSDNNLIPMINVVFLLLVFFMIAGIVRHSDPLPLKASESSGDKPVIAQSVLYVSSDGTLMLDESSVSMASLNVKLANLKIMPTSEGKSEDSTSQKTESSSKRKPPQEPLLAIKADFRVTVALLGDIMLAVRNAGLSQVELITTWVPADTQ